MCDCKEKILKNVEESVANSGKYYKDGQKHTLKFKNEMYSLEDFSTFIGIPIVVEWEHKTQKGKIQNKAKQINVYPSHCPFCGKAYKEAK